MVRHEGWARLSKGVGKAVGNRKPRGLGRRGRVSNLQQQPRAAAAEQPPQRQLHKKILGVLGRRAAQGMGTWRWKPNLVLGKVVRRSCGARLRSGPHSPGNIFDEAVES